MSSRLELSLGAYLAEILEEKLRAVLKDAGFRETLRVPEPDVTEFERGVEVLSLEIGHVRSHRQTVAVESEDVDPTPLVGRAAKETILEVSSELLCCLPSVDPSAARERVDACLSQLLADS